MTKLSGFTEAELEAFEWSKRQKEHEKTHKHDRIRKEKHRKRHRNRRSDIDSRSSDDSASFEGSDSSNDRNTIKRTYSSVEPSDKDTNKYKHRHRSHSVEGSGGRKGKRPRAISSSSSSSRSLERDHKSRKKRYHKREKHRKLSRRSYSSSSVESSASSRDLPRDPFNPLNLAYSHRTSGHRYGRKHVTNEGDKVGGGSGSSNGNGGSAANNLDETIISREEDRWKHDLYESDSERVSYEAQIKKKNLYNRPFTTHSKSESSTKSNRVPNESDSGESPGEKPRLITKRGWKSRAGGVYIPGDEDEDLYYDYKRSVSYERPDPSYTLD